MFAVTKFLARMALRRICAPVFALIIFSAPGPSALASPEMPPAQASRVEGTVTDQTGAPIASAEVFLKFEMRAIAEAVTGTDGRFVFNAVSVKSGTIVVRASGFAQGEQKWSSEQGDVSQLRIALVPLSISEQVTVTAAARTETRLAETAASIIVLASAELSNTAAMTIDDALREVPGFSLFRRSGSRTANPTSQGASLRGTGASGASRALVLQDGVPLNDPFGGWIYWGRVARASVNQIEVLRGGASNLYGSGALGGVINIITRKATPSPTLLLEASYGNQRTPDATLFAGGGKGRWSASLAAESFRTNGYIAVDERQRGRVDSPSASRHTSLELTLERHVTKDARAFVRGSVYGEARAGGTPLQTNRTHIRQISAGGDWQAKRIGAMHLRAYGGTQVFDQNFSAPSVDRNNETLARVQRVPAQVTGFTVQWSRSFKSAHTVVAGLDAREVRGRSDERIFVQGRQSSLVSAGGRERAFGLFAEDIVRIGARLFITGGVRVDRWRNFAASIATRSVRPEAITLASIFADRTETAFSPQLSMLYKPGARISFSAAAYRAFRAPTLNELYRNFRVGDVSTLANENLRAERLTGGEAGASVSAVKRKLNARGTFFWSEMARPISNVTLSVAPNLITRQRQNLGRTRAQGLELETEARLTSRWTISAGYLFADAFVLRFPANTALEGLRIPQVARHQFTFQTRYRNASRTQFSLQARAAGAQFDDDQNRFRLERYFTLDAFASHPLTRGLEVFAAAENLFNQQYATGRTPVTTLSSPRLWRFGIRLRLGSQ